jgi:hypothetical protein
LVIFSFFIGNGLKFFLFLKSTFLEKCRQIFFHYYFRKNNENTPTYCKKVDFWL